MDVIVTMPDPEPQLLFIMTMSLVVGTDGDHPKDAHVAELPDVLRLTVHVAALLLTIPKEI